MSAIPRCPVAAEIFNEVLGAMQRADEIGGPEGMDYVNLMAAIAEEAQSRAILGAPLKDG